ncbi:MAG: hypothetical protein IIU11_03985 [Bacteroidales bacterium]|jgi:hypothetical protein|nr:hypothetical protein [Bacteroidales bacterium]
MNVAILFFVLLAIVVMAVFNGITKFNEFKNRKNSFTIEGESLVFRD